MRDSSESALPPGSAAVAFPLDEVFSVFTFASANLTYTTEVPMYNHWLLAMGKLYQDPARGTVTRSVRPKVSLHWRTERLLEPCKGRPPRVATELQTLMEEEKLKRSTAICGPDTGPHTRKQLIEQEELLAQAYHYLATRPK